MKYLTNTAIFKQDNKKIGLMSRVALVLIWLFQQTRILRQPSCRFYPSCSQYTADSMKRFGFLKGLVLGTVRLAKCHPWHDGGVDDVPESFEPLKMLSGHAGTR
ncbi:MAG TPA: membrane protein insertion efficiency factor YidD [Candidatus Obscuribacter sp.]|nr:membrane protein insertion efficiency factor YidD [Candidatus Melainabacteria bacterium]MBK8224730.1 membrane protein insertion efficiency factor YidD [Candidatus Obscuribacter sp.]MBK9277831.1 membrane protein insertion efficiency factor YidD [Candidatus Obscuribacter sp.]MDX1989234.1 membrane protein insertion efficiency factor YidD [Candidatus Obscuribacter sp.]HMW89712.1 membrane protein insertion efficiency factor YidD [Candidatus Obscuribacter sp.]